MQHATQNGRDTVYKQTCRKHCRTNLYTYVVDPTHPQNDAHSSATAPVSRLDDHRIAHPRINECLRLQRSCCCMCQVEVSGKRGRWRIMVRQALTCTYIGEVRHKRVCARYNRHLVLDRKVSRCRLITEHGELLHRRTDKYNAAVLACLGKVGVLREKSVALAQTADRKQKTHQEHREKRRT